MICEPLTIRKIFYMEDKQDFDNLDESIDNGDSIVRDAKLIKDNKVQLGHPVKINSKNSAEEGEESIEPIIENDQIIGVVYQCKCGRSRRILFEYNRKK